jgi:hypothetical protein
MDEWPRFYFVVAFLALAAGVFTALSVMPDVS